MFCEGIYIERKFGFLGSIEATPYVRGKGYTFNTMKGAFDFCKAVRKCGEDKADAIYNEMKEEK